MSSLREYDLKERSLKEYEDIKVGDYVTSYFAGIWEVLEITDRSNEKHNSKPLVKLRKITQDVILTFEVRHQKSEVIKECCISFCFPLVKLIEKCEKFVNDLKELQTERITKGKTDE